MTMTTMRRTTTTMMCWGHVALMLTMMRTTTTTMMMEIVRLALQVIGRLDVVAVRGRARQVGLLVGARMMVVDGDAAAVLLG
jgi:hypothetical protein